MPVSSPAFGRALTQLQTLPTIPQTLAISYLKATLNKTRLHSHLTFLRQCERQKIQPSGFQLKFHGPDLPPWGQRAVHSVLRKASSRLISVVIKNHAFQIEKASLTIKACRLQLASLCLETMSQFIINTVKQANQDLYHKLKETKDKKMSQLLSASRTYQNSPTLQQQHQSHNIDDSGQRPSPSPPTTDKLVVTIPEDFSLPAEQRQVLSRGLKFIPLKPQANFMTTQYHCQQFFRRLRLAAHFQDTTPPESPTDSSDLASLFPGQRSTWTPEPGEHPQLDYYISKCEKEIQQIKFKPLKHSNLSADEIKALEDLKLRRDIVVKPADKGGSVVVWRKDLYEKEVKKQLSDTNFYSPIPKPTVKADNALVRKTIRQSIDAGHLPSEATRAIVREPRESKFYVLPKIHKTNNPGRPIVSACSCPTSQISEFLDSIFQPLVSSLPTYIKDTNDALQLLSEFKFPPGAQYRLLFTMDITSLYSNIPHNEGLKAIQHFLHKSTYRIDSHTILRLAELVLTLNSFSFGDEHFLQRQGVAMGTKMGPSYACLFVGFVEKQIFEAYTGPVPAFFKRFIDDIVGITFTSKAELQDFIDFVCTFHPSLKFTYDISELSVSFLDIRISVNDLGQLSTTVFYKPTDSHSYLTFSSSHPTATKLSIPFSQFLRLRRLCSNREDFLQQADWMSTFFLARGYPSHIVTEAKTRAGKIPRSQALTPKFTSKSSDRTILTLVYHPHNITVKNILLRNFHIIQRDPQLGPTFRSPPLVAFKRDNNIRDYLVHSSHRCNSDLPPGNQCCHAPRCKTCPFLDTTIATIKGPSGRNFTIKSAFTCKSTNIVYIIMCTLCSKLYVGETYRTLNERFNEHLSSVKLQKDTPVGNHFNSSGHNIHHMKVAAVQQNFTDWVHRKFQESHLIQRLGTISPNGINIRH